VPGIDCDSADIDADETADRTADGQRSSPAAARGEPPRPGDHPPGGPPGGYSLPVGTKIEKPAPLRPQKRRPRGLAPATGNPTKTPHAPVLGAPEAPQNPIAQDAAGQLDQAAAAAAGASVGPQPVSSPAEAQAAWDLIIDAYKTKPVEFTIDIIGVTPDTWQAEAMRKVAAGVRRLSVRAGHGVGKSAFCAWLVIWHMVTRFPQKTVLTAPTQGQLFDALFAEVKSWTQRLPEPIRELFDIQSERIIYKAKPNDSFVSARTSSAERPEALAGVHSEHVLLIADEASAIPEAVFEAAAGSMSGFSACTILISNPTRNSGLFFMTHHALREDWETMHVSCVGNPRVSADFVKQIAATYGETSNQYRVRVLGEFSLREDDVLIPAELVDAAMERDIALDTAASIIYGVDIARFGDDRCVLVKRQGNIVVEIKWWAKEDTMQTVGRIVSEAKKDNPAEICIDTIGVGGGVADRLRELGFNAIDVNVSESAAMNPQASRLRDDLWLQIKDWLNSRAVKLPKNERLRQDLVAPTYSFNSTGKIVVEPKALMKRRKLPSPDYADALGLTFAGLSGMVGGRALSWVPGKPLRRNLAGVV
jgi:phage terminase large subunit